MSKSYIVSGCLFGDEGKGTISDYLGYTRDIKECVRYNGGSQASHTVTCNGVKHKFSQLGSAFMNDDTRTYLSKNTIVNPFNIYTEAKVFSDKVGISPDEVIGNLYISKNSKIVTPYHSLIRKIRELSSPNNRTGAVGTGVSEVYRIGSEIGITLSMEDIVNMNDEAKNKLLELASYTRRFVEKRIDKIKPKLLDAIVNEKDLYYLTNIRNKAYIISCYENMFNSLNMNVISDMREFHNGGNVLFEGSQALLLDRVHGIKPNVSLTDTTNNYGVKLAEDIGSEYHRVGCMSVLASRHGMGVLPTYNVVLQEKIHDENQLASYFQGVPRYGWFDAVLLRYSLKVNPVDSLFLSCVDLLDDFNNVKICNSYIYVGEIDDEFKDTFDYYVDGNRVIINDIKRNSDNLRKYLARCIPMYIELPGWKCDTSQIKSYRDLPNECNSYIELLEYLVGTKVSIVGVGADRCQKLERIKI